MEFTKFSDTRKLALISTLLVVSGLTLLTKLSTYEEIGLTERFIGSVGIVSTLTGTGFSAIAFIQAIKN